MTALLLLGMGLTVAEPLDSWRQNVKISPVSKLDQHSIHAYFNASPESPDGKWVLFYASTTAEGHEGEIRILERATGREVVLSRGVVVEDAHRAACQQWVVGGKYVVFHKVLKNGDWVVMRVEVATQEERVIAWRRMVGFGQPDSNIVPIYGPHHDPGEFRDLELLNVATGASSMEFGADLVAKIYPDQVRKRFGDARLSIYIPMLSPNLERVFFKLAKPLGGDYRSKQASLREGLICFDFKHNRFRFMHDRWGHPAWHPDSRHILNTGGMIIDSDTGKHQLIPNHPKLPGTHPSFSPDGKLYTSDTLVTDLGGPAQCWGVGVGDATNGEFVLVHRFDNSKGARSWRVSHPHPAFSPDGRRLYFNVSQDDWTRLFVAEAPR